MKNQSWPLRLIVLAFIAHVSAVSPPARRYYDTHQYYALEHTPGTPSGASLEEVSRALGIEVVERAGELEDVWLVRVPKADSTQLAGRGDGEEFEDNVMSTFRDLQERANAPLNTRSEEAQHARRVVSSVNFLEPQIPKQLVKRAPPLVRLQKSAEVAKHYDLKDPMFPKQWHLVNDANPEHMMNTTPVWDMGFTGKGVLTSFLDDGLDYEAIDLRDAFDQEHSYDFNLHLRLPRPVDERDSHGTRCAGQVAARRNDACGVGIAYDSKAAGVRILGGPISGVDEAAALNYGYQDVSVYSCSWGPRDDGMTMEGSSYLIRKAVLNGINKGRDGKGSIFVFASGNGAYAEDQCNYDGYTNSIYSVTVSAVNYAGKWSSYSETCSAVMVAAYTSGGGKYIVTTDRGKNACADNHGGTSAAAPNAVGVFALALQARPDLTWRDIQHLCVETGRMVDPVDGGWEKTAAGRMYSYKFGYGALDAWAFVTAAQSWKLVKPQAWIRTETVVLNNGKLRSLGHKKYEYEGGISIGPNGVEQKMKVTKEMILENNLEKLEHIDVRIWVRHTKRGDVKVELVSPNGIKSLLAGGRQYDEATTGFPGWRLMTIKHWGENPVGDWTLRVSDKQTPGHNGSFLGYNMVFWGSSIDPSKAKQAVEQPVDNALPPDNTAVPVNHEPHPTSATQHAKPTDHLPSNHGQASDPGTGKKPQEDVAENSEESWYSPVVNTVKRHKWFSFFASIGFLAAIIAAIVLWRRRQQQLKNYSSLGEDEILMDSVEEQHGQNLAGAGLRSTRSVRFDMEDEDDHDHRNERRDNDDDGPQTSLPAHLQAMEPPQAKSLGFHSGFLDDDEPSPAMAESPNYRDHPEMFSHIPLRSSMEERVLHSAVHPIGGLQFGAQSARLP
ncbi:hypothetical protein CPC08DRAFT_822168 [Agrocybe pediades]|nr:hypothetical protein CPC08DRAFT_822168 [Agrocybe pediades]